MKNSEQIAERIQVLEERKKKLERTLERMNDRIWDARQLYAKALEKERPERLVDHLETVGEFTYSFNSWGSIWYHVKIRVDGEVLQYGASSRPRVRNAKVRVEADLDYDSQGKPVLKVAPRIEGGKIFVKEYFIEQLKEAERKKAGI